MKAKTKKVPAVTETPTTSNGNGHLSTFTSLSIQSIVPSSLEPQARRRAKFTEEEISELAQSIQANGLIQPITVRPKRSSLARNDFEDVVVASLELEARHYEIVCGERRYLACKRAGLKEIDAVVRQLSDAAALDIQVTENLQRKDVDPIDEAFNFKYLLELGRYTVHDLALKLGRTEKFIRQRLRLNELLPEFLELLSLGALPIGHAMEIAKYTPAIQKEIHEEEWIFEDKWGDDPKAWTVLHLTDFRAELRSGVSLKLADASFDIADGTLHPDGLACGSCSQRTGFEPLLFEEELADGDSCLNKPCFEAKAKVHLTRQRESIAAKLPNPKKLPADQMVKSVPLVTSGHFYSEKPIFEKGEKVLTYQKLLESKECKTASPALVIHGERKGSEAFICTDSKCKKHNPPASNGKTDSAPSKWELESKEREFAVKVANKVRERIFLESVDAFSERAFWADKDLLADLILHAWYRNSSACAEILKAWDNEVPVGRNEATWRKYILDLPEDHLSQLVFLITYAGEGYSSWSLQDQSGVRAVNDRYAKLNYTLLDAEARVALAPKEFKSAAKTYLKAIQSGEPAEIPHFWHKEKKEADDA